jgi:hypothetical protein
MPVGEGCSTDRTRRALRRRHLRYSVVDNLDDELRHWLDDEEYAMR